MLAGTGKSFREQRLQNGAAARDDDELAHERAKKNQRELFRLLSWFSFSGQHLGGNAFP